MTEPRPSNAGTILLTLLKLPFQLIGVAAFVVGVVGLVFLWKLPALSRDHNLDLTFVLLRTLDVHRYDPLFYLPDEDLDRIRVEFPVWGSFETVEVGPHRYEHRPKPREGDSESVEPTVTSTTRHTNIPVEELERVKADLETFYPREDETAWKELRAWGKGLFLVWWSNHRLAFDPKSELANSEGTEEEYLWFAWNRLRVGIPRADDVLPKLRELVGQAYPDANERRSALAWARKYGQNLQSIREVTMSGPAVKLGDEPLLEKIERTAPPLTEWTLCWLLNQHVGLDDSSRESAKKRWLGQFLDDKADEVLAWGKRLESERRAADEPLPPSSEVVALLCAFERMRGTDAYGMRCRELPNEALGKDSYRSIFLQLAVGFGFFPNDDIYYYGASEQPGGFSGQGAYRIVVLVLILLGIRALVFGVVAQLVLRLGSKPLYQRFHARRKLFSWGGFVSLLLFLILPLLAWRLALLSLPDWLRLQITSDQLLQEVYISTIFAGGVFLCVTQLLAVLLIFFGVDPERSWLDEIIGIPLAIWVLWHFHNDAVSILSYLAVALIPEVLLRSGLIPKPREKPAEDIPTEEVPDRPGNALAYVGVGCGVLAAGFFVLSILGFFFGVFDSFDEMEDHAEIVLTLISEGKTDEAYKSTSAGFRAKHDEASFAFAVDVVGLREYSSVVWDRRGQSGSNAILEGNLTTKSGETRPLSVRLVEEEGTIRFVDIRYRGIRLSEVPTKSALAELAGKSLSMFGEAVRAGDFTAFHKELAKTWKSETTPRTLREKYRTPAVAEVDFGKSSDISSTAVGDDGELVINGHLGEGESRVGYTLRFVREKVTWALSGLEVELGASE